MTVNTLYVGLLVATIAQSTLLIGALLTSRHGNRSANYLLSGIIALFSYYTLVKILCGTELIHDYPHFIQTYMPLPFLIWAALYFYVKAMTDPSFRFQARDSVHLLPFGLYIVLSLPFFLSDGTTKLHLHSAAPPYLMRLKIALQGAMLLVYLILSYRVLRRHQQHIQDLFSNLEHVKLDWLKFLLIAFGVIWASAFAKSLTGIHYVADFAIPPILLCLAIYAIGFYALKQPEIFTDRGMEPVGDRVAPPGEPTPVSTPLTDQSSQTRQPPKYEYSALIPQDLSTYGDELIDYLEKEKPYTNNELKLQDIADNLGIPQYQLSQVLNTKLNVNFYTLVNGYRIEEAKRRLMDPKKQHLTILAIAYDVGFNSKSAFNTSFKKYTNMTPSQFKTSQVGAVDSKPAPSSSSARRKHSYDPPGPSV